MSDLPQLYMRKASLDDLPELSVRIGHLPDGITLHTHINGEEAGWEALLEKSFGSYFNYNDCMKNCPSYNPDSVFYLNRNGIDVAVAAAVVNNDFPNEGWLHFVAVDPAAQGLGLSKHVVMAVLYSFYAHGIKSVVLSTDDFRIPAIKTYLRLGFKPIMSHESHEERWREVMAKCNG